MKGQITVMEMVAALVALFVAVGIFFPGSSYRDRWSEANLLLKGRDLTLTMDRTNILNSAAFDQTVLQDFLNKALVDARLLYWSSADGAFKSRITVACNCTSSQISDLNYWIGTFKVNNRTVSLDFIPSNLDKIPSSDVLLIWNDKDLSQFKNNLKEYLTTGSGIVLLADVKQGDVNSVHKEIFGVTACSDVAPNCGFGPSQDDTINVPTKTADPFYLQYKLFYHTPMLARTFETVFSIPTEGGIQSCSASTANRGNFTVRNTRYDFWTCETSTISVYFDTDADGKADKIISKRQSFSTGEYNFFMSYVQADLIHISTRPTYKFVDFLKDGGNVKLAPLNNENNRVFVQAGEYDTGRPVPVVVVNGTASRVAWIADFTEQNVNDDEKLLFGTLLLSSANKQRVELPFSNLRTGFLTNYINTVNIDMFEVYKFSLGLGFPF